MLLFMLMTACGASAQKGFFGSISRSKGVEYFYTAGVNRNNPNLKKGVPRIKGIDVEYLVSHLTSIEMVSATRPEKGDDMTGELEKSVMSTIKEKDFETLYEISTDEQELTVYAQADNYGGYRIVITQLVKNEPQRYLAVLYRCMNFDIDKLFTDSQGDAKGEEPAS